MIEQILAYNTLVVLAGVGLLGAGAGLIGSFTVLRRQSLTGDAVAHAALPGVCLAFLLIGQRNLPLLLLGALASGVLGMVIISALRGWRRVKEDSAIGIVLSVFPGLGFVLVRLIQDRFTTGSQAGLESFILGKTAGMTRGDVYLILLSSAVCLAAVILLYKEFKLASFDPGFARAIGWPVFWLDLALMTLVALAAVIGLPAVGAVMMAALLITPGAAARFWTDRLSRMLVLAACFGLATGLVGTLLSARFDKLPAGPIIVLTGSSIFVVSMLLGTQRGLVARWIVHLRNRRDLRRQLQLAAAICRRELEAQPAASAIDEALATPASRYPALRRQRPRAPLAVRARRGRSRAWLFALVYTAAALVAAAVWLVQTDAWRSRDPGQLAYILGTIGIGIVCNACCAILGCFLVLRRMSLLGDAISHSVLPGLAVAFLLSGRTYGLSMFLGAMAIGVLTSFLAQSLHMVGKVPEDASLGVVFTTLFALGVIMLQFWASRAHIDAECVLYGQLEYAWNMTELVFGMPVPRVLLALLPALAGVAGLVMLMWKELKIVSFDPALAAAMGFRVGIVHYLLMAMVAAVTVSAFEAVGSIVVVAMLVVPGATAALVTERLWSMIFLAILFGALSAVFGCLAAWSLNTNIAGMTAVVAGIQFGGAVLLAPRHGLASQWLRQWSLSVRIAAEDVLGRLFREDERRGAGATPATTHAPTWRDGLVLLLAHWQLARRGMVEVSSGQLRLTETGRAAASRLVRAHRLWESYLNQHFELPANHLHEPAEHMEHFLDEDLQAEIDAELAGQTVDPHGKEIPAAGR
jgi:ABC-type Mn2+/Zn2+ transport system permease subunit